MHSEEKNLIDGLFSRIREVESQSAPRDATADELIREHVARQPAAPYYMAQAIIVQENALKQMDTRVKELEAQIEELKVKQSTPQQSSGGFLSGLFGGGRSEPQPAQRPASTQPARAGGWSEPGMGTSTGYRSGFGQQTGFGQQGGYAAHRPAGGGFLSGALQTAAGVAGGMLLGNMLMDMFNGDDQQLAESATAEPAAEPAAADESAETFAAEENFSDENYADSQFLDSGEGDFFGGDDEDFV